MAHLPILISGAGIGGLSAALCLARHGFKVILVEKRTSLEEVGAGLQLSPNASHILIGLGLGKALSRAGCTPLSLDVRQAGRGALMARAPLHQMQDRYGAPYLVIHRADLQQILLDHVRSHPDISIIFGRMITEIVETDEGLNVTLDKAGQTETLKAGTIIGADGLHSQLAELMGDGSKASPSGFQAWRGTLPMSAIDPVYEPKRTTLYLGAEGHAVTYPIKNGEAFNLVVVTREKSHEAGWSRPGDTARLHKQVKTWKALSSLIQSLPEWQVWSLYDRAPRRRWSYGRVALLGDAAHPVLPFLAQGAALAIEDSAVLAQCLAQDRDHPDRALARYQDLRLPRASRVQDTARKNRRIYHLPFPLSLARDMAIRQKNHRLLDDYQWLYGWTTETPFRSD